MTPTAIQPSIRTRPAGRSEYRPTNWRASLACLPLLAMVTCSNAAVTVSPAGHYVSYNSRTLAMIGDSGTQCILQNLNIDYRAWLDDCHDAGIRAVHIWSFVAPRQKQDGTVIEQRYGYVYPGATPWARRHAAPTAFDQLPRWDLTRFDEGEDPKSHYWPRLRDLCKCAADRDIIVGITVFFGWPKHNRPDRPDWAYHPFNAINGGFLTDEKPITTACQHIHSPGTEVVGQSWNEHWPPAKKTQWVWERFAQKLIRDTNQFGNVFFVFMDEHSYPEGNCGDHFCEFFQRRGATWVDWEKRRETVDMVTSGTFSAADKNARAVAGFTKQPPRPYLHLEGGPYRGNGVRTALWTFAIGGGHYFFHDDAGQGSVTRGIMGYDPNVSGGDKNPRVRQWLGHASRFFNEHIQDLDAMAPHNELIASGAAYCLAALGRQYAVYSPSGDGFRIDLSAVAGPTVARFYNPRTGQFRPTVRASVPPAARVVFRKPDASDWAVLITAH